MSNTTENFKFPIGTLVITENGRPAKVIHNFINPSHKMDVLCIIETKESWECDFYSSRDLMVEGEINRFVYREDLLKPAIV